MKINKHIRSTSRCELFLLRFYSVSRQRLLRTNVVVLALWPTSVKRIKTSTRTNIFHAPYASATARNLITPCARTVDWNFSIYVTGPECALFHFRTVLHDIKNKEYVPDGENIGPVKRCGFRRSYKRIGV